MASESLGGAYMLTSESAAQLASVASSGSAPVSSPGFVSQLHDPDSARDRLSALEELVRHRPSPAK